MKSNNFTKKDANIMSVIGMIIGSAALIYSSISSITQEGGFIYMNVNSVFAALGGIMLCLFAFITGLMAEMLGQIEALNQTEEIKQSENEGK